MAGIPFLNNTSFSAAVTVASSATAANFITTTDNGININGITLTRVAANSAIRVGNGLETLGLLRSYAGLAVGTTGTFGGNVTVGSGLGAVATDGILSINGGSGTGGEAYLRLTRGGASGFILNHTASAIQVRATANIPMFFYTNDTISLKINANNTISLPTYAAGYLKTDASGNVTADNSGGGLPGGPYLPLAGGTLTGNLTLESASPILKIDATGTGNPEIFFTRVTGDDQNARIRLMNNRLQFENEGDPDSDFLFQGRAAGQGSLSDFLKIEDTGIVTSGGTFSGNIQTTDTTGSSGVLRIRSTTTGTPSYGYPNVGAGDVVIEGGGTTQRQPGVITLINDDSSITANQDLGVIQFVGKDDAANGYASSQIIGTSNNGAGTGNSGGGILKFLTSNGSPISERMRIENDGKVGIGVTSPQAPLHVSGDIRASRFVDSSNPSNFYMDLDGTSYVNHLKVNSILGTKNFSAGNYGWQYEQSTTTTNPVTFRFDNQKYRVYAGGGVGEIMTFLETGRIGIGETSPDYKLEVNGDNGIFVGDGGVPVLEANPQTGIFKIGDVDELGDGVYLTNTGSSYLDTYASGTLQMRFDSNGRLGINTTSLTAKLNVVSPLSSNGIGVDFQTSGGSGYGMNNLVVEVPGYGTGIKIQSPTTSGVDNGAMAFFQVNTKVGSIQINTSSTSYNTTSDYRLKENKEDISDAIERVKQLKPVKFNWIKEPNGSKVDGFYAHELADIVPEAVTGEKDALDHDGNPSHQAIDQSKIVPLLTAALQQAIDKIEALELKINKLNK